jgi:hypothetical protein
VNEEELKVAKGLISVYDTYMRIEYQEIPKLETEMKSASAKVAEANKGIDQVIQPMMALT